MFGAGAPREQRVGAGSARLATEHGNTHSGAHCTAAGQQTATPDRTQQRGQAGGGLLQQLQGGRALAQQRAQRRAGVNKVQRAVRRQQCGHCGGAFGRRAPHDARPVRRHGRHLPGIRTDAQTRPTSRRALHAGASCGMTTVHARPHSRAASASAAPWLPDECVTTPPGPLSCRHWFIAPRTLNEPARCRFSHCRVGQCVRCYKTDHGDLKCDVAVNERVQGVAVHDRRDVDTPANAPRRLADLLQRGAHDRSARTPCGSSVCQAHTGMKSCWQFAFVDLVLQARDEKETRVATHGGPLFLGKPSALFPTTLQRWPSLLLRVSGLAQYRPI